MTGRATQAAVTQTSLRRTIGRAWSAGVLALALGVPVLAVPALAGTATAAATAAASTAAWQVASAQPAADGASAVACATTTTCVAVGTNTSQAGDLLRTTDSGATWTPEPVPAGTTTASDTTSLNAVACPTTTTCLAVGGTLNGGAQVLVTSDAGATWTAEPLPTVGAVLDGISCPSATTCTAVGATPIDTGVVVTTTDGGTTWTSENPYGTNVPTNGTLVSISCPSTTTCFAVEQANVSYGAAILATTDGGATWTNVDEPPLDVVAVSCASTQACVAVGGGANGDVAVTTDGGTTWTEPLLPIDPAVIFFSGVACVPGTTSCTAVGIANSASTAFTLSTSGSLTSWSTQGSVPAGPVNLTGVACPTTTTCQAVGLGQGVSYALASVDAGATWTSHTLAQGTGTFTAVTCPSASVCYATGSTSISSGPALGAVFVSTDGGTSWSALSLPAGTAGLAGIACASVSTCVAVGTTAGPGPTGLVVTTTDGGTTWTSQDVSSASQLFGVACPTTTTCQAVGVDPTFSTGVVLTSADGGTTWTSQTMSATSQLTAVACPSATTCEAVGQNTSFNGGVALRTTDTGTTWTSQPLSSAGSVGPLSAVACPSTTTCQAVGFDQLSGAGQVATTTDSGTTWTQQLLQLSNGLVARVDAVACASTTSCEAVGVNASNTGAVAVVTSDGGATWAAQTVAPGVADLTGVTCSSATACVAVGIGTGTVGALVVTGPGAPSLSVTTTSLPTAEVGVTYSGPLAATGGTTPDTWSVVSGALPNGLQLDAATGVITGTPTTVGPSTFTVQVTDQVGATASAQLTVSVLANTPPPVTVVGVPPGGATLTGGAWLDASASSAVGVRSVEYVLSGGGLAQPLPIAAGIPTDVGWLAAWASYDVPNGTYALESVATDVEGQTGTSAPITVTVDNQPVHTSVLRPAAGAQVSTTGTVVLDASAGSTSAITGVVFSLEGGSLTQPLPLGNGVLTLYGWVVQWNPSAPGMPTLTPGTYSVVSSAIDADGNTATSAPVTVTLGTASAS